MTFRDKVELLEPKEIRAELCAAVEGIRKKYEEYT